MNNRNKAMPAARKWQPMGNASFPEDFEAKLRKHDPGFVGVFKNDKYQAMVTERCMDGALGPLTWITIRRLDSAPVHDWRDLQRIKNDICGAEREAVEIYPAESRLVDTNNNYHLFVLPEGMRMPFGYTKRDVSDKLDPRNANKQRPFDEPPADLNANVTERDEDYWLGGSK